MSFYIFCPIFHVSKTFCSVLDKKLLNEIFGYGVHVSRPVYFAAEDLLVDAEGVVVEEGRVAGQHLVHEDAQRPPVHRLVVALDQWEVSIWSRDRVSANPSPPWTGWSLAPGTPGCRTASTCGPWSASRTRSLWSWGGRPCRRGSVSHQYPGAARWQSIAQSF